VKIDELNFLFLPYIAFHDEKTLLLSTHSKLQAYPFCLMGETDGISLAVSQVFHRTNTVKIVLRLFSFT
jgi:hypothetical protein